MDLYRTDCLPFLGTLEAGSIDVVVTSPPYNLGTKYNTHNDRMERTAYLDWMDEWARAVKHALAAKGSLFLNIGSKPRAPWISDDVAFVMRKHFVLQNRFIWVKSLAIGVDPQRGHYKPLPGRRFVNDCWEYVLHLTPDGDTPLEREAIGARYADQSNRTRWEKAGELHCRGNVWFLPYKTIRDRRLQRGTHPATFPVGLPKHCLMLHGLERIRLACDPFVGIGHSAFAATDLGVPFVGCELDTLYWSVACEDMKLKKGATRELRGGAEYPHPGRAA